MIDGEKETIRTIVTGLQACYKQHLKDKNLYKLIDNIEEFMFPYNRYLDEISEDVKGLYDDAAAEGNSDKMLDLMSIQSSLLAIATDKSIWSSYKSMLDDGMDPGSTEQEAEEAVVNYINGISEFFYGGNIIK